MKKKMLPNCLIVFFLICYASLATAVVYPTSSKKEVKIENVTDISANDLRSLNRRDMEKKIGRKLKFKERLALRIIKKKLNRNSRSQNPDKNQTSSLHGFAIGGLVFGVVGIFFAGIILGLLGFIFSAIALNKFRKHPGKFYIRLIAIVGLLVSFVAMMGAFIIIISL